MENNFKKKIQSGAYTLGTFIEIGNMSGLEALCNTGLDYVIIDAEHGHFDTETITDLIRAAELNNLTPLVRIGEISRAVIQKVLDSGAMGLIVPGLQTIEEVRHLVQLAKFPPLGQRGYCPNRGSRWGACDEPNLPLTSAMKNTNDRVLLIPQCETKELLEVIDEVVQIDGVDGVFIGPFDLSISMGLAGQFDHPTFKAATTKIRQTVKAAGKILMYFSLDPKSAGALAAQGYDGITLSLDTRVLQDAYQQLVTDATASVINSKTP